MRSGWPDSAISRCSLGGLCLAILALLVVGGLLAAPAAGGDRATVVYTESETYAVPPGGTVEVPVLISSDGGYEGVGLETMTVTASYETAYLTATGVDPASYMKRGNETDVYEEHTIDAQTGNVTVTQWRDPPRGGSTGNAHFATITFDVAADAPETNTTLSFANSRGALVGEYDVFVFSENATLRIDEDANSGTDSADEGVLDSAGTGTLVVLVVAGLALTAVAVVLAGRARDQ
jgi:hypothetical protein